MQQGHEGRGVGRDRGRHALGECLDAAQQEDVGLRTAVDVESVQSVVLGTGVERVDDVVMYASGQAAVGEHGVAVGAAAAVHVHRVAHQCRHGTVVDAVARGGQRGHVVDDQVIVAAGQAVGVAQHAHMPYDGCGTQGDDVILALAGQLDLVGREAALDQQRGADAETQAFEVAGVAGAAVHLDVAPGSNAAAELQVHVVARLEQHVAVAGRDGRRIDRRA